MNFDFQATRPVIFGCRGLELAPEERAFFAQSRPFGFILFARNVATRAQLETLIADLRSTVPHPAPVLIDQEGGRVARLRGELAHDLPPMARIGALYSRDAAAATEAAALIGGLLAHDLLRYRINVDCVPVLDVPAEGSHKVIGDRAFSRDPEIVSVLGKALARALMAGGVLPVIKHIPGHGRASADSHLDLPIVEARRESLESCDFVPFRALADMPMAMTAHVVYAGIDRDFPATWSRKVIASVIRDFIGFDGLLMTDDLSMKALGGDFALRTRRSLNAGCDVVLHCNGEIAEMRGVIAADPRFGDDGARRARAVLEPPAPSAFNAEAAWNRLRILIGGNLA